MQIAARSCTTERSGPGSRPGSLRTAAWLALVAWLAAAPQSAARPDGEGAARLVFAPNEVDIGQPVEARLEVTHAAGETAELRGGGPLAEGLDAAWELIDGPRVATRPAEGGRAVTTWRWQLIALEPGERALPALEVAAAGVILEVAEAQPLFVRGELESGEDAPRPPPAFHDAPADRPRVFMRPGTFVGLAALALVLALGTRAFARRLGRRRAAPGEPTPKERLLHFARNARGEGSARTDVYGLTSLLRAALDERAGLERPSLTDEEWLDAAAEELSADRLERLRRLFAEAEAIKYAGREPTPFAVDELASAAVEIAVGAERREAVA